MVEHNTGQMSLERFVLCFNVFAMIFIFPIPRLGAGNAALNIGACNDDEALSIGKTQKAWQWRAPQLH
jgi:hypothetical protein